MKWRNWLCAAIGLWFIIAPWALGLAYEIAATWASVIAGVIQVIVSAWAAIKVTVPSWKLWPNWVSLTCGFWFLLQPFLGEYEEGQYWTTVILGLVTMILNLWTLMSKPKTVRRRTGSKAGA